MLRTVELNPFHPQIGLLTPTIVQRIMDYTRVYCPDMVPERVAGYFLSTLLTGGPVLILVIVEEDTGKVIGHVLSEWLGDHTAIQQYRLDGDVGNEGLDALKTVDQWTLKLGGNPSRTTLTVQPPQTKRWRERGYDPIRVITQRRNS